MSGLLGNTDLTQLVGVLQGNGQILAAILQQLRAGVAIQNVMPSSTVAALPAVGEEGQFFWASDGRKTGEGGGSGTGCPVFWNPATSQWYSFQTFIQVTA